MSRFWDKCSDSESHTSSSSDEDIEYADQDISNDNIQADDQDKEDEGGLESHHEPEDGGYTARMHFMKPSYRGHKEQDSDDEEDKRVVRSARDKRWQEIEATSKRIEHAGKVNDWVVIFSQFEKLNKLLANNISKQARCLFIKTLISLQGLQTEAFEHERVAKKMNATNARALNTFRQRIRKIYRDHQEEIKRFQQDPTTLESLSEDEPDSQAPKEFSAHDSGMTAPATAREKQGFISVRRSLRMTNATTGGIFKTLKFFSLARGKKFTDRTEQVKVLEELKTVAVTPYQKIHVLLALISSRLDYHSMSLIMPTEQWTAARDELLLLFAVLEENRQWIVVENGEDISYDGPGPEPQPDQVVKINGSLVSFIDRLDAELTKALQNIDPHTPEYVDRLCDEQRLYLVIVRGGIWFECIESRGFDTGGSASRLILKRLEHIYYKSTSLIENLEKSTWAQIPITLDSIISPRSIAPSELIQQLAVQLYKESDPNLRTLALLYHIYNLSLNGAFQKPRDMLLTSHLQETIQHANVTTHIAYNRALAQLGIAAFRLGMIIEAQYCLQDLIVGQKARDLLAQNYSLFAYDLDAHELAKQIPFHMHINLELLECVYLVSSMLLEIPAIAKTGSTEDTKRVFSKLFRRYLGNREDQVFLGPPENIRDRVLQASRHLASGDWKTCHSLISQIEIWGLFGKDESDRVKAMLRRKIQEVGLRTFLFSHSPFYHTLSIASLAEMFSLTKEDVKKLVSGMISTRKLQAKLDHLDQNLIFPEIEKTRVGVLSMAVVERIVGLVASNQELVEQLLDSEMVQQGTSFEEKTTKVIERPKKGGKEKAGEPAVRERKGAAGERQSRETALARVAV